MMKLTLAGAVAPSFVVALWAALAGVVAGTATPASAQDNPALAQRARAAVALAATGPRTSPFSPPAKDVFVTDAAPGLDTGCTFNSSPLNPLTIDVMVDRYVGDVDGNGFLLNPAPLISAGIIPASVEILMPAFDIDFNGSPPPERDEVLLNGQSLGFLTGDDGIWKLNSFTVDVRRIKFPTKPAPGAAATPVANRVQVRIDTLGADRWCTSLDWVALLVPIRPKLALELDVVAANPVYSNTGANITRIFEQRFDAACNVQQAVGPIAQFPFSGPALSAGGGAGIARLKARIKACPDGSLGNPTVTADWAITGAGRSGSVSWTGAEGFVEYSMPATVGSFDATLKITNDDGQTIDATRRLYVTRKPPLVANPRINWYDKGTAWASGQSSEAGVIDSVATGLYGYGNAAWRYGYFPGKCTWDQLMASPLTCNYADCYVFSDVLQNISGTLGVGGLATITVVGSASQGFLTTGSPSLDPAFRGNARPLGVAAYDRYLFSSHSLRLRAGTYYDATFNGRYGSSTAFIFANLNGTTGSDANGGWLGTAEGRRVYPRPGNSYDSWGNSEWAFLNLTPYAPLASLGTLVIAASSVSAAGPGGPALTLPGSAAFSTVDANADGRAEQLIVDVDVDVAQADSYVLMARLESTGGLLVANRPAFDSMQLTRADVVAAAPGRYVARLRFSGEQIRRARIDGPWRVAITANSATALAGTGSVATPAYRALDFGETKVSITSLVALPLDADSSGRYETVRVNATVDVTTAGMYGLQTDLQGAGNGLAADSRIVALAAGPQNVQIDLPAAGIARSGIDAPYELLLNLSDSNGGALDSAGFRLVGYLASQFETPVSVAATLTEQPIDTNGNGLYETLRVGADVRATTARPLLVQARLVAANGASVDVSQAANLTTTPQRVSFDFPGATLRRLLMSSQYTLALSFRLPTTLDEIDAASVPLRGTYTYAQFDSGEPPRTLALNGQRADAGIDTNANGLFDVLSVSLGLDVATAGVYDWSARLVDRNGVELGFAASRGSLPSGAATITLRFDGRPIGVNGLDGPFFLRSLLVSSSNGASLVAPFAGSTSALAANRFEGFVARAAADLNGDGVVDVRDVEAFNRALGSSVGEPNYNRFADFDRDGRVTLNDLRYFRAAYGSR